MPISSSEVALMLSVTTGTAGASTAQPDPTQSLGNWVSTTSVSTTTLDNIFNDITGAQNAAGQVDYRCIFVQNNDASLTMLTTVAWFNNVVAGGATVQMAADNIAASAKAATSAQAAVIGSATTAPTGVGTFVNATTAGAGVSLGSIGPGQVKAIWIKRTAMNTAALNNDGFTLEIDFDTTA